ncbi:rhomboid family intramembrane serine protease [Candidatus Aminicenantes bacterium AC-335-K20]|jgi:membrane associated rhomboid family serine protease|nr:rhomboid family intramembrane serine protease [SCandidatus Aminicenantes bacterium Aminicenantia_JdfR_composite]MCP2597562.1 rhomboid family intramembrane serine protease [Candidatus Aminicenantes bacterium AC-335-G13]MCP2606323.1 rhomboid family intramembrane serine protease [Candidatus Aminicenantes bacterium AC-708-I09]MCP2617980.1 rhomboid family intramembrane serine protease [Candidatus Aminicenantes bacterium AC-335-A11]MCP2619586.1 rhomboid family intramembrane serine protease [Candid
MFIPLRDENPTAKFPFITVSLIGANILIFFYQFLSVQGLKYYIIKMGAVPWAITHLKSSIFISDIFPPLTILTSMFIHAGFFHLFGNMLYLWIFGNNIEDFLGHLRFFIFYILSGIGAALTHIIFNPNSTKPMVGASGAIAGVLGAYLILYPYARVHTLVFLFFFIRVIPIPAGIILSLWFIIQVMNIGLGGGIAWFAHIGGFLAGIGLIKVFSKRRKTILIHQ